MKGLRSAVCGLRQEALTRRFARDLSRGTGEVRIRCFARQLQLCCSLLDFAFSALPRLCEITFFSCLPSAVFVTYMDVGNADLVWNTDRPYFARVIFSIEVMK
jgi:hypothetical protein